MCLITEVQQIYYKVCAIEKVTENGMIITFKVYANMTHLAHTSVNWLNLIRRVLKRKKANLYVSFLFALVRLF